MDSRNPGGLELADFLRDLRDELEKAQLDAIRSGGGLRLGVEQIEVTLDVVHSSAMSGEVGGKLSGKFWVFASAELSAKAGNEKSRTGTQTLTLTLRPRVEYNTTDSEGLSVVAHRGLDVRGEVGAEEQQPPPPPPPGPPS